MKLRAPHYLLFSESRQKSQPSPSRCERGLPRGQWRFVLESVEGSEKLEAVDEEPETNGDRLELLAVVRGLEALDQPSRVTLVTRSRYVARGFRFGLNEWRENGWKWEHFGEYTHINNDDLWKRVDHAMNYHQVECRTWRFDPPHTDDVDESPAESDPARAPVESPRAARTAAGRHRGVGRSVSQIARRMVGQLSRWVSVTPMERVRAHG